MPGIVADGPTVSLSFANNFWGKEDAGVHPLLERMHNAKVTSDELKIFYNTRAAIEDEYARKLLALCRKPLGSQEYGTLRAALDTTRGEVEAMGKAHQSIAGQMKSELEEPLAAFAGGLKERRKIVQGGVEKLFKTKGQQTQLVNKTRDRYEQDCLRIKGYLAQGHMVMGQEERKNKAKLEKTQIQVANSNTEYETAVKALEETTVRWNRDWKAACDKFQDLEEERLDFTKSSLWSFANIASTVCVTDDASCEKIRLSLEKCEVERDIQGFIRDQGTGQEIPDPPRYINFCRGDVNDSQSEVSEDDNYSVAQFQRTINPAFRTSSPQPSTYESHHDSRSAIPGNMIRPDGSAPSSREATVTPQKAIQPQQHVNQLESYQGQTSVVPHNEYPQDGMTMYCRPGPPSERSSAASPARPSSRDSHSEYSNPNSFTSAELSSGKQSPTKGSMIEDRQVQKKKSGFFQSHSPFRRKSKHEKEHPIIDAPRIAGPDSNNNRNTWSPATAGNGGSMNSSPARRGQTYQNNMMMPDVRQSGSPEPVDPRADFQLNVGNNVFDVASPDKRSATVPNPSAGLDDMDPIAAALAELKGVTKQSSFRVSADRYHGLSTPVPGAQSQSAMQAAQRGTPPPSYDTPVRRLDLPQPAFTSAQMQQTRQKYVDQTQNMFGTPNGRQQGSSRPSTRGSSNVMRATSPAAPRSASPRPGYQQRSQSSSPAKMGNRGSDQSQAHYRRSASPQPQYAGRRSDASDMQMQISQNGDGDFHGGSYGRHGRDGGGAQGRPQSFYGAGQADEFGSQSQGQGRPRSKSAAPSPQQAGDGRQMTRDGRPILHFARAIYLYSAAIPEELSFGKGDILAVLRLQDDGWWEAEVVRTAVEGGRKGGRGLVPSNYLMKC